MTCAIAMPGWVGVDSWVDPGGASATRKWERVGPYVVAWAGALSRCQYVCQAYLREYVSGNLPEQLAERLRSAPEPEVDLVIASDRAVWEIEGYGGLLRSRDGWVCIGSGAEVARGAMAALGPGVHPRERIDRSLRISGRYVSTVGGPYRVVEV